MKNYIHYNTTIVVIWMIGTYFLLGWGAIFDISIMGIGRKLFTIIAIFISFLSLLKHRNAKLSILTIVFLILDYFPVIVRYYKEGVLEDVQIWKYSSMFAISSTILLNMNNRFWDKLKGIEVTLMLLVIINFFDMILHPNGSIIANDGDHNTWFIGQKNTLVMPIISSLVISIIVSFHEVGKISKKIYIMYILAFVSVIISKSTTSFLIMSFLGLVIIYHKIMYNLSFLNIRNIFVLYVVLSISIMLFNIQTYFIDIFQLFGKDATLTGRTDIYELSLLLIAESPVWGYGIEQGLDFAELARSEYLAHTHNLLLWTLIQVGSVGLIYIFCILFYISKQNRNFGVFWMTVLYSFILLGGITEPLAQMPVFYFWLALFIPIGKQKLESNNYEGINSLQR